MCHRKVICVVSKNIKINNDWNVFECCKFKIRLFSEKIKIREIFRRKSLETSDSTK